MYCRSAWRACRQSRRASSVPDMRRACRRLYLFSAAACAVSRIYRRPDQRNASGASAPRPTMLGAYIGVRICAAHLARQRCGSRCEAHISASESARRIWRVNTAAHVVRRIYQPPDLRGNSSASASRLARYSAHIGIRVHAVPEHVGAATRTARKLLPPAAPRFGACGGLLRRAISPAFQTAV